jgi:chromosome partitioning protein
MGNRVLMVDLDPQAHLTASLAVEGDFLQFVDDALSGKHAKPTQTKTENVCILPSRIGLSSLLESGIFSKVRWEEMLLKALDPVITEFDLVVIDTPATFSKLHTIALRASDAYVISLRPEAFSVVGYDESRSQVEAFKEECGISKPIFLGYILSGVPKAKRRAVDRIREGLGAELNGRSIEIPLDVAFDEARWSDGSTNRSIFDWAGTEELQAAYLEACGKLTKWMNDADGVRT